MPCSHLHYSWYLLPGSHLLYCVDQLLALEKSRLHSSSTFKSPKPGFLSKGMRVRFWHQGDVGRVERGCSRSFWMKDILALVELVRKGPRGMT